MSQGSRCCKQPQFSPQSLLQDYDLFNSKLQGERKSIVSNSYLLQNDEEDEEEEEVPQPTPPTQDPKPKALPPKTPDQKESTILKVPVVVGRSGGSGGSGGTPLSSTAENGGKSASPSSLSPPTPPPPPTKIRVRTDLMHLGLMEKRPPHQVWPLTQSFSVSFL